MRTAKNIALWMTACSVLGTGFSTEADTMVYTLDNVILDGNSAQMRGTFIWAYDTGDFENGIGMFSYLDIPFTLHDHTDLDATIDVGNSIEITLDGSVHDDGVDFSLFLSLPLTPVSSSTLDLIRSKYEIGGNGFHDGLFLSGTISPTGSSVPDTDGDGIRDGLDPNPGGVNNNACSAAADDTPYTFTDQLISGVLVQCADHDGINVGANPVSNVHVMNNGELHVITPVTTFMPGFKVDAGGKLAVYSELLPD